MKMLLAVSVLSGLLFSMNTAVACPPDASGKVTCSGGKSCGEAKEHSCSKKCDCAEHKGEHACSQHASSDKTPVTTEAPAVEVKK